MAYNPGTGLYGGGLTNGFGNLTGNVTGNLVGNVVGNLTGDVVGDLTGNVTGTASGNLKLNSSTDQNVSGAQINFTNSAVVFDNQITANVNGVATGNLKTGDSVINMGDVTSAGSGNIITQQERDQITANQTAITGVQTTLSNQASILNAFSQDIANNAAGIGTNLGLISNKANDADVVKLTGNQNITGTKGFTDLVARGDGTTTGQSGKLLLNCSYNNHGVTIQSPAHSASATYTLTLPTALPTVAGQVLSSDLNGVLSWVTMSSGGGGGSTIAPTGIYSTAGALSIVAGGSASGSYTLTFNTSVTQGTLTIALSSTAGITFTPSTVTETSTTSTSFTVTAASTVSAGTHPIVCNMTSVGMGSMGFNTPVTLTGAITVTAPTVTNDPWTSSTPNGWTQIMHIGSQFSNFYDGDAIQVTWNGSNNILSWVNQPSGSQPGTSTNRWQTNFPSSWNEICFQTVETTPAYWVIFDKTVLYNKLYNMGFDWTSGSNGWYMVPFARSASVNRTHTPSGKTCMLFSDIGIVESSADYVFFTFNQQSQNPYIRVATAPPNTPSDVLTAGNPTKNGTPYVFQENDVGGKNTLYPHGADLGVFVR